MAASNNPSPAHFFETVNSYQRTAALKGAIELELFSAIGSEAATAGEIAKKCNASERGVRILCDYLVIGGFLTKEGKHYRCTPDTAAFLDRKSPAYLGGSIDFMLSPLLTDGFKDIAAVVRKGGAITSEHGVLAPEHPVWVRFARAMAPMMKMPAEAMAKIANQEKTPNIKVLDISASHGVFGIAVARANPNARIIGLDWPNVLEVAKENARAAGIENRYGTIAGSAFEVDFGKDYDVILLPNFLHHFDVPTCEKLLKKVHAALAPSGRVLTLEFIPNEDRVSPPGSAAFSFMMLGTTPAGDAYTYSEIKSMFDHAGYSRSDLHAMPAPLQQIVASYK